MSYRMVHDNIFIRQLDRGEISCVSYKNLDTCNVIKRYPPEKLYIAATEQKLNEMVSKTCSKLNGNIIILIRLGAIQFKSNWEAIVGICSLPIDTELIQEGRGYYKIN